MNVPRNKLVCMTPYSVGCQRLEYLEVVVT
jgi:hypothetical protein